MGIEGSVAVRDLLPLLRDWNAQVIAGASGLGRAVTWANTMRPRLPAFDGLRPGDLAILSLSALRSFNTQAPLTLSGAVEQLAEMGASAVVVIGLAPASASTSREAPNRSMAAALNGSGNTGGTNLSTETQKLVALDELRRRADEHALPVVALAAEITPIEVERAVIAYVVEHRQHGATDALRASLRNETLDALLSGAYTGEAQMRTRAAQVGFDLAQPYIALWIELVERVEVSPAGHNQSTGATSRRTPGGAARADELAQTLSVALGAWARVRKRAPLSGATGSAGPHTPSASVEHPGASEKSAHEASWLAALYPTGDALTGGNATRLERTFAPEQVVALLPLARAAPSSAQESPESNARLRDATAVGERLAALLTRTLGAPTNNSSATIWIAGLGAPAQAPAQARRSAEEARDAARLGATLFGVGRVTRPSDLGVYRLLLAIRQSGELEAFVRQTLAPLQADERSGEALIETLEAFFACNGNLSEAARRLGLHRNSLLYRLSRARELLGHDLDDPELRLSLQLAIKSQRVLRLLD